MRELRCRVIVVTTWAQEGEMGQNTPICDEKKQSVARSRRKGQLRPLAPGVAQRHQKSRTYGVLLLKRVNPKASRTPGPSWDGERMRGRGRGRGHARRVLALPLETNRRCRDGNEGKT